MCSCTTHSWLARPVNPHHGDQALAGHTTERPDAIRHALAGALAVYDRRAQTDDHTTLLLEVSVDSDVIGWLPLTPRDGHRPDRDTVLDTLERLHGSVLGIDIPVAVPDLPTTGVHRVDLDPATDQDNWTGDLTPGDLTPGTPGPTPWS